jgi:hypothetical protein
MEIRMLGNKQVNAKKQYKQSPKTPQEPLNIFWFIE